MVVGGATGLREDGRATMEEPPWDSHHEQSNVPVKKSCQVHLMLVGQFGAMQIFFVKPGGQKLLPCQNPRDWRSCSA